MSPALLGHTLILNCGNFTGAGPRGSYATDPQWYGGSHKDWKPIQHYGTDGNSVV